MKKLAGHNLPQRGRLLVGHGLTGVLLPRVDITGLTNNPTYGNTAQDGVTLTAVPVNFTASGYLWRTVSSATALSTTATYTPNAATHDLAELYCEVSEAAPAFVTAGGVWSDAGVWDDTASWSDAA